MTSASDPESHRLDQPAPSWPPLVTKRTPAPTAIGQNLHSGERVKLSDNHRPQHISIIGKTGYGKTTLLEHLILADLASNTSAILIDPDGDLSQRVITLASPEERERITLLEVWDDRPFRLNLLACPNGRADQTVSGVKSLFKRLFDAEAGGFAPRLETVLENALRTLIPNNGTLADIPELFFNPQYRSRMLQQVTHKPILDFWAWFDGLKPADQTTYLESTIGRLTPFLASETAYAMVAWPETTTIPFDKVLDGDGQLLLIRIPTGQLRQEYARFYGSLFLNLLTEQLFAREAQPESVRHRLHLYLDEYGWFATSTTAELLQRGRKYGLGTTIALQTLADLPDEKNKLAALQVGTFVLFQLVGQNADELVSSFPVIPREQREETIWEAYDKEPVKGPTQEPVKWLVTNGHKNPRATNIAQTFLKPFLRVTEERKEYERRLDRHLISPDTGYIWDHHSGWHVSSAILEQAIEAINNLLITVMQNGPKISADTTAETVADIMISLELYYGLPAQIQEPAMRSAFGFNPGTRTAHANDPAFRAALVPYLGYLFQAPNTKEYFTDNPYPKELLPWPVLCNRGQQEQPLVPVLKKFANDAIDLLDLCKILSLEPIVVATGQEKDRQRPHHITYPAQGQQDARLELAGVLATLPRFTAYYQTPASVSSNPDTYGQLHLSPPAYDGPEDLSAIEEIRKRSKERYGRPIQPTEKDNSPYPSSQPRPSEPGPQPPGPRLSRRSPRAIQK